MRNKIIWFFTALYVLLAPAVIFADFSDIFTTATPTQSSDAKDIDDYIRQDTKRALQERLAIDHYFIGTDAVTSDTVGFHKWVSLLEQATDPDTKNNVGRLYTKDTDGVSTLYFRPHGAGTALRLTWATDSVDPDSCVLITGNQTIAGKKTFSEETTFSDTANFNDDTVFDSRFVHGLDVYKAPTLSREFAPKGYVDAQDAAQILSYTVSVDTAIGTSDISVDTSVYQDMTDMTYTDTFTAGNISVSFSGNIGNRADNVEVYVAVAVDGVVKLETYGDWYDGSDIDACPFSLIWAGSVTAGSHTITIKWKSTHGIVYQFGSSHGSRFMTVTRNLN